MKIHLLFLTILILVIVPAQAAISVNPVNISSNYIKWEWTGGPLTGINIDGSLVSGFDPNGTAYILSDLNPNEIHQITIYTTGDNGTSTVQTLGSDTLGSAPLGLWIYALVGVAFLVLGRLARVRFIFLICTIFGLLGSWQLIGIKEVIDPSVWTLSLIVYLILVISGTAAYIFGGKNNG